MDCARFNEAIEHTFWLKYKHNIARKSHCDVAKLFIMVLYQKNYFKKHSNLIWLINNLVQIRTDLNSFEFDAIINYKIGTQK